LKIVEVRCGNCNKQLFKIIDDRYIEITCSRVGCDYKHRKLIYDMKGKELTNKKFPGKIILG
jgi:phage FluMu protein Com